MDSSAVLSLFRESGALHEGHFKLSSGLHSPGYLQCALVLQHPAHAEALGRALGDKLRDLHATVVLSPALGGLIIGHEVARAFGVPFLFAERDPATGHMTLRRGFEIQPGQKAIVIEDVVTTGGSSREVMETVRSAGGVVLAAGSIIDRSNGRVDLGVPRVSLEQMDVVSYDPSDCVLCKQGLPVVKPGSRKA